MQNYGELIQNAREQAGLTQKQLSEKYEIPLSSLRDWENEQHKCPTYVLKLLLDRLVLDYCMQSKTNMCEDPEYCEPLGREDYFYLLKNRADVLYCSFANTIEGVDEFCDETLMIDEEDIVQIKSYLQDKYGKDWTYVHYRDAALSYLYNVCKQEVIGYPIRKED